MRKSIFHKLSKLLWAGAVAAIVTLAVYVSLGRLLASNLGNWQGQVTAEINRHLPFKVSADNLQGSWSSFTPGIALHDLEITLPGGDSPLNLIGGRFGVDVLDSLATRSLQFTSLRLEALELQARLTEQGKLVLPGFTDSSGEVGTWLREFLLNLETLELRDNVVHLSFPGGEQRTLSLDVLLTRSGSSRQLDLLLRSDNGTRLHFIASGLGDPFRPKSFVGDAYAELELGRLDRAGELFAALPAELLGGGLQGRAWLQWSQGNSTADLALAGKQLHLRSADGEWEWQAADIELQARLQRSESGIELAIDNARVAAAGESAALPRSQLHLGEEGWQLRTAALELEPLYRVLATARMPETWSGVFSALAPRGDLQALQLTLPGGAAPTGRWHLSANFSGLAVDAWHGAPGLRNAGGYLELEPGGGRLALEGEQFSLLFPGIYAEPLDYHRARARFDLGWDERAVTLRSGLIEAVGDEGTVHALFGLGVPLQTTAAGVEMELLAGLSDSHPRYRNKYLPEVLDAGLRKWLAEAVGEGRVSEAGFLWRGSLRPAAAPLRSVQAMLNFAETELKYQPEWPPLQGVSGVMLVDDINVSVWGREARLYDARLASLSAETWKAADGPLRLVIDTSIEGAVADALATVSASPLERLSGGAFRQWRAEGPLAAQLHLELDLSQAGGAPSVELQASVEDTGLSIEPGGLQLEKLAGSVAYSTRSGFSSQQLQGQLWGRPLAIELTSPGAEGAVADGREGAGVAIAFEGRAEATDIADWLRQPALQLARGEAAFSGSISLAPAQPPQLYLTSSLEGMALDLPAPWSKAADSATAFSLTATLGDERRQVEARLADSLALAIDLAQGADAGFALGLDSDPPAPLAGGVRVAGHTQKLDVEEWQAFGSRYFSGLAETEAVGATDGWAPGAQSPRLDIAGLQVAELHLWNNVLDNVEFNLQAEGEDLAVQFSTPWLAGQYRSRPGQLAALDIDSIDLGAIPKPEQDADPLAATEAGETAVAEPPAKLPDLRTTVVNVQRLLWKQRELGELRFRVSGENGDYRAESIAGQIAGLVFSPQRDASLIFEEGGESRLSALLEFSDFGNTLAALGYARSLETDRGSLDLALSWTGAPQDFSLTALNGSLGIAAQDGRFLETGSAGALKVVEILNLAGVVERLSLSHVFETGIAFDQMTGEAFFYPGSIELADLTVRGSSSAFAMSGVSDIASRSLDGELVATLPVANNLPWVAALAGGLPVAAGVFVVSKVFEKQVNRLSSGVYRIEGTWNAPEVTFDRIFDDEMRTAEGREPVLPIPDDPNSPVVLLLPDDPALLAAPQAAPLPDPNQPGP